MPEVEAVAVAAVADAAYAWVEQTSRQSRHNQNINVTLVEDFCKVLDELKGVCTGCENLNECGTSLYSYYIRIDSLVHVG